MTTATRRTTLKLGAAAIVLGPSVMFSRTASAAVEHKRAVAYKAGQFIVKVDGVYDTVPGVISVDLGSLNFAKLKAPEYSGIKIELKAGTEAPKLTVKFSPETTKFKKGGDALKIQVSLLAADGVTPSLTYQAMKAQAYKLTVNEGGAQTLWYKIGGLQVIDHKSDAARFKLPGTAFKVEIEGLGTMQALQMSKAVYDWQGATIIKAVYDGVSVKSTKLKIDSNALKVEEIKFDSSALKIDGGKSINFALKQVVTTDMTQACCGGEGSISFADGAKIWQNVATLKIEAGPKGGSVKMQDFHFKGGALTSVQFPTLQVGSDAIVTQTLNFASQAVDGI